MRVPISWLQEFISSGKLTPAQIAERLTMGGLEVERIDTVGDDTVLEIAVTPNRSDALSISGVAREFAALCKKRVKDISTKIPRGTDTIAASLRVTVADRARCPRYAARRLDGVRVAPSPSSVQRRLEAVGIRPINNIVDATNYVMWELGQPLHAFDARTVRGGDIGVRCATNTETNFTTLDGVTRALLPTDLLICDTQGAVALAGIMGGANSEVRPDTTTVIVESAYFVPTDIRRTSKRLGLSTESSRRFERGVDPNAVVTALHRAVALIQEWAGGTPSRDWIDLYPKKITPARVAVGLTDITRLLGIAVRRQRVADILKHLGCSVQGTGNPFRVAIPTFRPDLTRPVDLIEEVARIYGYDHIAPVLPPIAPHPVHRPSGWSVREQCLTRLQAMGFLETVHYAFEASAQAHAFQWPGVKPLTLTNPLGQDQALLKTTLAGGLVDAAARNYRNGQTNVRLCELRPVIFVGPGEALGESLRLAGIIFGNRYPQGWTSGQDVLDFFDIKGIVEMLLEGVGMQNVRWETDSLPTFLHPGHAAWAIYQGKRVGYAGALHPALKQQFEFPTAPLLFECDVAALVAPATACHTPYQPLTRHPSVRRDISMLVERTTSAQTISETIHASHESWITTIHLFDCYDGERLPAGKKSLAYAIHYQHPARTLTDDEVNTVHARLMQRLVDTCGVEIRH